MDLYNWLAANIKVYHSTHLTSLTSHCEYTTSSTYQGWCQCEALWRLCTHCWSTHRGGGPKRTACLLGGHGTGQTPPKNFVKMIGISLDSFFLGAFSHFAELENGWKNATFCLSVMCLFFWGGICMSWYVIVAFATNIFDGATSLAKEEVGKVGINSGQCFRSFTNVWQSFHMQNFIGRDWHFAHQGLGSYVNIDQVNGEKHTAKYICVATGGRAQRLHQAPAVEGCEGGWSTSMFVPWLHQLGHCALNVAIVGETLLKDDANTCIEQQVQVQHNIYLYQLMIIFTIIWRTRQPTWKHVGV